MSDPEAQENEVLGSLQPRFLDALARKERGDLDRAEQILREILRIEPRLPEPQLELARILLDTERLDDAESHARQGLDHLEAGGQWTDDLPNEVVESVAHALLAEILRQRAETDEILFGDPAVFRKLVEESRQHFAKAAALDPSDATASYYAIFMGPRDAT